MIKGFAPAKVNLALHVTAQRTDGLHLLDSLVCFADVGDRLEVSACGQLSLVVKGAQTVPTGDDNLVLKAARSFGVEAGALISLCKHLPVAAGLGGGSADAACALRLLSEFWQVDLPSAAEILHLGADVPVCLAAVSARMQGVGGGITRLETMPSFDAVLVNPGVGVSTKEVFNRLEIKDNPALAPPPEDGNKADWFDYILALRNDLTAPAIEIAPGIAEVLDLLFASNQCAVARMSGSGATCFGLFQTQVLARRAAQKISALHPDWWVVDCLLGGSIGA